MKTLFRKARKIIKKIHPEKISREKAFLIIQETKPPYKLIFYQKQGFLILRETKTPKKFFQKLLIFQEMELSSPKLKKLPKSEKLLIKKKNFLN